MEFSFNMVHPSWKPLINQALACMDQEYLHYLRQDAAWLPGPHNIFNAFSLPLANTRYILFGESPYPRCESANGYAFWDAAAGELWSNTGLSKPINRATSLRNFIKMLLLAGGYLQGEALSQPAIAALPKTNLVTTISELFTNIIGQGILLLNASLALSSRPVTHEAKYWRAFVHSLLQQLHLTKEREVTLILFGNIAQQITDLAAAEFFPKIVAPHPYNLSFIQDTSVQRLFAPMRLLQA